MATKAPTKEKKKAEPSSQLDLAGIKPIAPPVDQPLPRLAYTLHETAKILGISYISVYRLVGRGLLKCSTALPGRKLIPLKEIEKFLSKTT